MDYRNFYELSDPIADEPFRLRSRLLGAEKADSASFDTLSKVKSQTQEPVQFHVAQGSEATDVLWTQLRTHVCVSEGVVRILRECEASGWSTYPVEVYDQGGKLHASYHGLAVTGSVCEADYSRSSVITKPPPTPRGRSYDVYRGLYFDVNQWDGTDMFWVGSVRVIVKRLRDLLEINGIKNVRMTPLIEREIRVRHVQGN